MNALPRSPWLISKSQDLLWFHGSVLAGLVLLLGFRLSPLRDAAYAPGHLAVLLLLIWGVVFDGTHVLGTYARSYLVRQGGSGAQTEVSRAGLPGAAWLLLILVGPVCAVVDALLLSPGHSLLGHASWLFRGFLLFAYLWAYWHLVRQHYGFLVLYQRRAGTEPRTAWLEQALLWIGCLYPFLRFSLSDAYVGSGLPLLMPPSWLPALRLGADVVFGGAAVALGGLWLARRQRQGGAWGPAHLLLVVVVGFHLLVFAALDHLLTITATLTIFHNLQYHRIVWQHERGYGRVPAGGLWRYLGLGLLLGLCWYGPRVLGVALVRSDLWRNVLIGLGWGVAFHHYLVDGRIWRVRRTPQVARALDAGGAP